MASVAHVGFGYWGRNLARNFAALGALSAVVDDNPDAAAAGARTLGVRASTFDAVLADPAIDAVSLATPAALHAAHAKAALLAGKHVFVEKPMALSVADAEALVELAETRGLTLMVGHLLQYHPVYRRLREMVAEGTLGRLLYVYSNRLSLGKFRTEENVLWSFAPHDISMILGLAGSEPESVSAQGVVSWSPGVADFVTVEMGFPGGLGAHVTTSWMHPFKEQRLVVVGERAMTVFEDSAPDWNAKLKLYRHTIDASGRVPEPTKADAEAVPVAQDEPLRLECQHFLDCVASRAVPLTDGREGLRVLRALDRAESALADYLAERSRKR